MVISEVPLAILARVRRYATRVDLDARVDELYAGPDERFVAERDALVKELRAAKDKDAAARIKALRRPTRSAWAVNQLWRRDRGTFDALLAAGERMRRGDLEAAADRRRALGALVQRARELLAEGGTPADPHLERVQRSLANLSAWGADPPLPMGQLAEDVHPPDLEELLAASQGAARAAPAVADPLAARRADKARERARADERARAEAEARARAEAEARARAEAEAEAQARAEAQAEARARAEAEARARAEQERARLEAALVRDRAALDEARAQVEAAQRALDEAEAALRRAERACAEAEARVRDAEVALSGV